ncbi:hypothetical protein, partial [Sediminibacillus massiliensis]|uniref:hypothetical protein n=1 Tax=Sediminibacillus massiliensis TaxID=1926277 RepID=UPI0009889443
MGYGKSKAPIRIDNQELKSQLAEKPTYVDSVATMKSRNNFKENDVVVTLGYFTPNDGGGGTYLVKNTASVEDGGSTITLNNGRQAHLQSFGFVNYKQFGAIGDSINDDGVQIKKAHAYANAARIPVVNLTGEYWLKETRDIVVKTSTNLGSTKLHVNEALAPETGAQIYHITTNHTAFNLGSALRSAILPKMKKGTALIAELQEYENHFIRVFDSNTKVGKRQGANVDSGRDMEEFFVVENGGRLVGDITWNFTGITSIEARKMDDNYLIFEGGTFLLSGDLTGSTVEVYKKTGIWIHRSRVIVRNQFVGHEDGMDDNMSAASDGFYHIGGCYDITIENSRPIPRKYYTINGTPRGTYGISGSRVINLTLRNLTGEGSSEHWGVMGTDLLKNVHIEKCRLNRVDVHFHGWNFTITDTDIGNRGFRLTGGGTLNIENVTVNGKDFVQFREDYGSRWDGDIFIKKSKLIISDPTSGSKILSFSPIGAYDYGYKIIHGRKISVEDFVFDYSQVPDNLGNAYLSWFTHYASLSENRVQYPYHIEFKNVHVVGREKGVRFFNLGKANLYYSPKKGKLNGHNIITNAYYRFDTIDTEDMLDVPQGITDCHIFIDVNASDVYTDDNSMIPKVEIINCKHLNLQTKSAAGVFLIKDSEIGVLDGNGAGSSKGIYHFENSEVKPNIISGDSSDCFYLNGAKVSWVNCTIHPIKVEGAVDWDKTQANTGIFKIWSGNFQVFNTHIGTRLSK